MRPAVILDPVSDPTTAKDSGMLVPMPTEGRPQLLGSQPITSAEVESYATCHHFSLLDEHRAVNEWIQCQVDPSDLRDMHGVFARADDMVQLEKGRLFSELEERFRARIEANSFPCAVEIRTPWLHKPRLVVQQALGSGQLWVADGEKRTFNALFNGEVVLDAFVVTLDQEREVL